MGLYGERVGAVHFITNKEQVAKNILSQLKLSVRVNWSTPPIHGARIASIVLNNEKLRAYWLSELKDVTSRITEMRKALREKLEEIGTPGTWNHITDQTGMFSFSGLTPDQVKVMVDHHHIYLTSDGRISVPGLNTNNVEYVAKAIKNVVLNH